MRLEPLNSFTNVHELGVIKLLVLVMATYDGSYEDRIRYLSTRFSTITDTLHLQRACIPTKLPLPPYQIAKSSHCAFQSRTYPFPFFLLPLTR